MFISRSKRLLTHRVFGCSIRGLYSKPPVEAAEPAKAVPNSSLEDNFVNGTNAAYLEALQASGQGDKSWATFLKKLDSVPGATLSEAYSAYRKGGPLPSASAAPGEQSIQETLNLQAMIRAHQVIGHAATSLDPLGLEKRPLHPQLDPAFYGFTDKDMDREFYVGTANNTGFLASDGGHWKLRDILARLKETYCGTIGYEYMHIPDRERCNWLRERIETAHGTEFSKEKKLQSLDRLCWSESFESFLKTKYAAAKRFGLEGAETLIPGLKALVDRVADQGTQYIVMGMPHRGRLNVLGNVFRKPLEQIFSEFSGGVKPGADGTYWGSGDVKYHLGTSYDRTTISGKQIHLSLVANPSHLEAVNTVVMGKTRAKQYYTEDKSKIKCLPILLHGDGSFSGQGIVMETLDMSTLPEYDVGGVIHVVVNNQVAFTTDPKRLRSALPYSYCTDVAKGYHVPIFHVNGDAVEDVVRVFELAADWRQKWKQDVVIDLVCYRKHGHNEIDEPMFTQPLLYRKIRQHSSALVQYCDQLVRGGLVSEAEVKATTDRVLEILNKEFEASKTYVPKVKDWLASYWAGFKSPDQKSRVRNTGVPMDVLRDIGRRITEVPQAPEFNAHKQVRKIYDDRRAAVSSEGGMVDWATAEALAFATLLKEGNHVRLAGQDVERGTFSHRHAVLHDQENGNRYIPITKAYDGYTPRQFTITNSSLSEFGALGYELGYSMENPNSLVLWEAQFGDFANGAQTIFDQFLSSGEAKWLRMTGLVCLLPHGYDGQGPEHSSARLERFLTMSDEDPYKLPKIDQNEWFRGGHLGSQIQGSNWQVCNITTPANYFHALRRQLHREFRKPLIVMSPKALLRHPLCKSPLYEFDDVPDDALIQGVRFKRLIMDPSAKDRSPFPKVEPGFKRLVLCSGKVYYDLVQERTKRGLDDTVALCRLEQLAPFPFDLVSRELRRYPNAEVVWAQEEHMNMGGFHHVTPRINACIREAGRTTTGRLKYSGRAPAAATATGFGEVHAREQAQLVEQALDLKY